MMHSYLTYLLCLLISLVCCFAQTSTPESETTGTGGSSVVFSTTPESETTAETTPESETTAEGGSTPETTGETTPESGTGGSTPEGSGGTTSESETTAETASESETTGETPPESETPGSGETTPESETAGETTPESETTSESEITGTGETTPESETTGEGTPESETTGTAEAETTAAENSTAETTPESETSGVPESTPAAENATTVAEGTPGNSSDATTPLSSDATTPELNGTTSGELGNSSEPTMNGRELNVTTPADLSNATTPNANATTLSPTTVATDNSTDDEYEDDTETPSNSTTVDPKLIEVLQNATASPNITIDISNLNETTNATDVVTLPVIEPPITDSINPPHHKGILNSSNIRDAFKLMFKLREKYLKKSLQLPAFPCYLNNVIKGIEKPVNGCCNDIVETPTIWWPTAEKTHMEVLNGIVSVYTDESKTSSPVQHKPPPPYIFVKDLLLLMNITLSNDPVISFARDRLTMLDTKFQRHKLQSRKKEEEAQSSLGQSDIYDVAKVDNNLFGPSISTQKLLVAFIKKKLRNECFYVVHIDESTNKRYTLCQLFELFKIKDANSEYLNVDALKMHANADTFNRYDQFFYLLRPFGEPVLNNLFLGVDNYIGGRYLAELIKGKNVNI